MISLPPVFYSVGYEMKYFAGTISRIAYVLQAFLGQALPVAETEKRNAVSLLVDVSQYPRVVSISRRFR